MSNDDKAKNANAELKKAVEEIKKWDTLLPQSVTIRMPTKAAEIDTSVKDPIADKVAKMPFGTIRNAFNMARGLYFELETNQSSVDGHSPLLETEKYERALRIKAIVDHHHIFARLLTSGETPPKDDEQLRYKMN